MSDEYNLWNLVDVMSLMSTVNCSCCTFFLCLWQENDDEKRENISSQVFFSCVSFYLFDYPLNMYICNNRSVLNFSLLKSIEIIRSYNESIDERLSIIESTTNRCFDWLQNNIECFFFLLTKKKKQLKLILINYCIDFFSLNP